ncbi:ABC transporter ATP-binding protein [Agromyces aerolatus]|uniref:ABC transporter ATP-binding protein n=1 Tax=Agromyces sp. LY-1074 TaxID=3074080 RepID=UPI002858C447|nr:MULTISPECIES: ATP-binding cassette domain-containing protein [unclassified Agromyces]MDR5701117.1 ATP-binding cassette domain-containing protein [Agromyces sp. LY-1074]MDR5707757.1 ATP-binding cassette domain-containing protein [Agromyces sp. LY-1358]
MLELDHLTKRYGDRLALDDVTFTVGDGRLTGFVGGNGAGKTTTMRIALGVLASDGGSVRLDGAPITAADRRRFGYMPEERGLYPKMKVLEQTVYLARLHGWTPAAARRNATDLLERLGLGERLNDTVESLSLGNQQRAQIAAALVHQPEVLVLDEPFSGLDPMAVDTVQSVLADEAAKGAPVLFSSHQLDVVERLCDDLVIIAGGRIRAAGSRDELREQHGSDRWELLTAGDAGWVRDIPGVTVASFDGGWALFEAETDASRQAVLAEAVRRGDVVSFTREQTTLAQIFREVVQ